LKFATITNKLSLFFQVKNFILLVKLFLNEDSFIFSYLIHKKFYMGSRESKYQRLNEN